MGPPWRVAATADARGGLQPLLGVLVVAGLVLGACATTTKPPNSAAHSGSAASSRSTTRVVTPNSTTGSPSTATVTPATVGQAATKPAGGWYGYLATHPSTVIFLEFTESASGGLTGSLHDESLSGSPPNESLENKRQNFSGTLLGGKLTMTLAGLSWSVSGQLMGRSLRFELRVSGGRVTQATSQRRPEISTTLR